MEKILEHIKRHVRLTPEEEAIILTKCFSRTYLKGQYIVYSGDVCRYHSFIESGLTRTFYTDDDGNEHIVSFGIEDWWAGDLGSFITQKPADFYIQCISKTEVIHISHTDINQLYLEVPKIERFFRLLIQNAYVSTQKRIVRNFSMTARERYVLFLEEFPQITQCIPLKLFKNVF